MIPWQHRRKFFVLNGGGRSTNHIPCLVSHGISGYVDSHKNYEWQGYAAVNGAAYMKDLLYRAPPNKVDAEEKIGATL